MQPFNILYLNSHDTGRYVQPYGHAVPTPAIQRLAEEGVLFRQAYCAAPQCSPSRAALLTGQSAHTSGMIGLAHRGFALQDYNQHLQHTLRAAGYYTAQVGVQHVAADAARIGYQRIIETPGHSAGEVASPTIEFLHQAPQQPFYLEVGFFETHREFPPPSSAEDARYCLPPRTLPDTPQTRQDMAAFKASARILDDGIGALLEALNTTGLAENTLVLCTTDHGPAFPGMKCNLTDHGIGVMLILRGPGGFDGGKVSDALVSQIDLFPTICEVIGIERPGWLQGKSLMPLIRGEASEINEHIFAEVTYHAAYEPQRAVRSQHWKYIRRFGGRTTPVLPNCDDSPSKDLWLAHGWRNRRLAVEELYDLMFDPNECNNLARSPLADDMLQDLRERLERWMRASGDPLLNGPVLPPPDARVNNPDHLSPNQPCLTGSEFLP